ncbi:MAG: trimeric intracellular cation channel family protein [Clostridiales bacterium]|nr:trimeric intracellular cation channel family protein [Clostridiales bacterium]
MELIIHIFEIIGSIAFAVSGVTIAMERDLDIFGATVVGVLTAVGGGLTRDVILGYLPPTLFRDPTFVLVAFLTCVSVFLLFFHFKSSFAKYFEKLHSVINVFDAIGLGIFVAVGMTGAINAGFGNNGFLLVFVGTITGVGGGLLRDVLVGTIPYVLKKHVYAVAAIIGALVYLLTYRLGLPSIASYILCPAVIITIRMLATKYKWNLPRFKL